MVSARSYLFEKLFHSSAEEQVVLGRGTEMYYASTLNDYCGVSLSEDELHAVVRQLKAIQETVEGNGGRFLFTVFCPTPVLDVVIFFGGDILDVTTHAVVVGDDEAFIGDERCGGEG